MRTQGQVESKLEQYKEEFEKLKINTIHKVVNKEAYELQYRVLMGQIHALEWVLEIKKVRKK
jgi:hypothetical protein